MLQLHEKSHCFSWGLQEESGFGTHAAGQALQSCQMQGPWRRIMLYEQECRTGNTRGLDGLLHFGELGRQGETVQLPLSTVEMRWLLLEMARCQTLDDIYELVSGSFGSLNDVALVRIWLLQAPGEKECETCAQKDACTDRHSCLHLVSSAGRSLLDGSSCTRLNGAHSRFPLGIRKVGQIAATGESICISDIQKDCAWASDCTWMRQERVHSFLGQPIIFRKKVLGVFAVFSRGDHGLYVMERLRMVADYMAVAIANTRAFEKLEQYRRRLEIENDYLRQNSAIDQCLPGLVGESSGMRRVKEQILQVAPTKAIVLITGESGTGKEIVATELHRKSRVADGPLVKVNCSSVPAELFESEFFGHVRGAFTGANAARIGFFEAANNGTLFLDEVGEIPLALQSKLLRVLQENEYHRVGEERTRTLNTRVIAATNRDLALMVSENRFRADLYYRLNVFPIETPPLRERREDIELLAEFFLAQCARELGRPGLHLQPEQVQLLTGYDWPGNIRELQNVIRRAAITAKGNSVDLRFMEIRPEVAACRETPEPWRIMTEEEFVNLGKRNMSRALKFCNGKVYGSHGAASLLGLRPTTLLSRLTKFGIDRTGGLLSRQD